MQNDSSTLPMLFRRTAAFLYDCLLLIALFFIITAISIAFNDGQAIQHFMFKLVLLFVAFIFFDWFWRHGGQTLGMRAWRIKLQSNNSASLSLKQSAIRFSTGLLLFGFTLAYMLISKDAAALHDTLSDTIIVRDNR
jgi:uncharacterized RDD family membrane protein YckC